MLHVYRYITTFGVLLAAYFVYALALAPWVEPPAVVRAAQTRTAAPAVKASALPPAWAALFPPDAWELKTPKVVETERCTLLMHPHDASARGLADGTLAAIRASGREVRAPVELSDALMPGVVSLPHGWGHDLPETRLGVAAERPGANLNALFDETQRDPLSGNAVLSGVVVEVSAAA